MSKHKDSPVPLIQTNSQSIESGYKSYERAEIFESSADKFKSNERKRKPLNVPSPNFGFRIFCLLLLFMICIGLIRFSLGAEPIYFSTFLDGLTKVPTVTFDLFKDLTIVADWGLFNWFRDFVNTLSGIVSLGVYLAGGIINILSFALYFVRFFFGF